MPKPVIGIIATHSPFHKINHPDRTVTHISDEVRQALIDNGAITIGVLPPTSGVNFIRSSDPLAPPSLEVYNGLVDQMRLCDGIMFQGGKNTDDFAYYAAHITYSNRIPTLGVCSGQTVMVNIFADTEMTSVDPALHNDPAAEYMHETIIDTSSKFYQIVKCDTLNVNSRHNCAVKSCPQLQVAATSLNLLQGERHIEVLEAPDRFYLSTRFHPESLYRQNPSINAIFQAFIGAAKEYRHSSYHL